MAVQICPERHLRVPKFCAPFSRLAPGGSTKKWPLQRWQWNCGTGNSAQSCRAWGRSAGGPWFVSLVVFSACFCNFISIFLPRSEDERSNSRKRNLPSLRRLTKNFVFQDSRGVHCRISSMPCKYVQKGGYKYTNFIRHFRSEHTEEAFEAGFVRDHNEASEPELELEREIAELGKGQPVDPDL